MKVLSALAVLLALAGAARADSGPANIDQAFVATDQDHAGWRWLEERLGVDLQRRSYALVIGVSRFALERGFGDLPTEADAIRVKDFLIRDAGFDYVHLLTEAAVTAERVRTLILRDFKQRVGADDRFLIYWSGHGATLSTTFDEEVGFLALADSFAGDPSSMVEMRQLRRWTDFVPAEQLLFMIDACFGGFAGIASQSSEHEYDLADMLRPSRQILTAGTEKQETFATKAPRGGVFTRLALRGLSGEADRVNSVTGRKDGVVTVDELMIFLKEQLPVERKEHRWRPELDPQLYNLGSVEGTFFFATAGSVDAASREWSKADRAATAMSRDPGRRPTIANERKADIVTAQRGLKELGFAAEATGELDRATEDALLAFQSMAGVERTGAPDPATLRAIRDAIGAPPPGLAALRDPDVRIKIVHQFGAEPLVDRLSARLDGAGIAHAVAPVYNMPGEVSGRLYFSEGRAAAAAALRALAADISEVRLTPVESAGDELRLFLGFGAPPAN